MLLLIASFGIAAIFMITEYLLCIKFKNPLFGGIIPILLLISTIFIFTSGIVVLNHTNIFPFVILNSLFLGDWITGRDTFKKKQQEELNKMKAHDIETNN